MPSTSNKVKHSYTPIQSPSWVLTLILFLVTLVSGTVCLSAGILRVEDQESITQQLQTKIAKFTNRYGQTEELTLEVASTPVTQTQGLMYRTDLAPDSGMLFVFDSTAPRTFWMQNTYIPLDVLFLDEDLFIVKIHSNTKPNQISEVYSSEVPVKYGLETNGGWAEAVGLEEGDQIILE
jgi:uncharacterized protein